MVDICLISVASRASAGGRRMMGITGSVEKMMRRVAAESNPRLGVYAGSMKIETGDRGYSWHN